MKRIKIFIISILTLYSIVIHAKVSDSTYIQFGELVQFPEKFNVLDRNGMDKVFSLSSVSKLTIIDFWNVWCASCIRSIPKMQALQEQFGDKIQILLVTNDTKEQVLELMKKSEIVRNTTLPIITNDTLFRKMFQYRTVPTHVWIDSLNILTHVTDGISTNGKNIANYLDGKEMNLHNKKSFEDIPLIKQLDAFHLQDINSFSLFAKGRPEYSGSFTAFLKDTILNTQGYRTVNSNISNLLNDTFRQINKKFSIHQMFYRESNQKELHNLKDWDKFEDLYCYEVSMPNIGKEHLFSRMKRDIEEGYGITISLDTIPMKSLSLILIDENKLKSKGGERKVTYNIDDFTQFSFTNVPFNSFFATTFGNSRWGYPYLINNKVSYIGNIDLIFNAKISDLDEIREELEQYGLKLIEENENVEILVLTRM